MRKLKAVGVSILLAGVALVLSSCTNSSNGTAVSFTLAVPSGMTAHATLQGSDGSVVQTKSIPSDTKLVTFTNPPSGSMVTISMYAPAYNGSGNPSQDVYVSLTVPTSAAAGQAFFVEPIAASETVTVSGACAATAYSVRILGWTSATCSGAPGGTFSTSINFDSSQLQSDGTLSLALLGLDNSSNAVAYATLLDRNFTSNQTITVAASNWTTPTTMPTNSVEMDFPALGASESNDMYFDVALPRKGQYVELQGNSAYTSTPTSITATAPYAPVSGSSYLASENYSMDYSDGSLNWMAQTIRQHAVSSLPLNETLDTQTDLWPVLKDVSWNATGGSPAITFTANAGTMAATTSLAFVDSFDSTGNGTYKEWDLFGTGTSSGTLQFPDLPSSLSAYAPHPVDSSVGYNDALVAFTNLDLSTLYSAFFGTLFTIPSTFNLTLAETNAPLHPASVGSVGPLQRLPRSHAPFQIRMR